MCGYCISRLCQGFRQRVTRGTPVQVRIIQFERKSAEIDQELPTGTETESLSKWREFWMEYVISSVPE